VRSALPAAPWTSPLQAAAAVAGAPQFEQKFASSNSQMPQLPQGALPGDEARRPTIREGEGRVNKLAAEACCSPTGEPTPFTAFSTMAAAPVQVPSSSRPLAGDGERSAEGERSEGIEAFKDGEGAPRSVGKAERFGGAYEGGPVAAGTSRELPPKGCIAAKGASVEATNAIVTKPDEAFSVP